MTKITFDMLVNHQDERNQIEEHLALLAEVYHRTKGVKPNHARRRWALDEFYTVNSKSMGSMIHVVLQIDFGQADDEYLSVNIPAEVLNANDPKAAIEALAVKHREEEANTKDAAREAYEANEKAMRRQKYEELKAEFGEDQ